MEFFFFVFSVEYSKSHICEIKLCLKYLEISVPMETVWGGGGEERVIGEDGTAFRFEKSRLRDVCSSVHHGQIPLIFYM